MRFVAICVKLVLPTAKMQIQGTKSRKILQKKCLFNSLTFEISGPQNLFKFIELVPALIFLPKLEFFNLILVIRDFGDIVANTGNCKQTAGILLFTAMQMISFGKSYFHINFYLPWLQCCQFSQKWENTKLLNIFSISDMNMMTITF